MQQGSQSPDPPPGAATSNKRELEGAAQAASAAMAQQHRRTRGEEEEEAPRKSSNEPKQWRLCVALAGNHGVFDGAARFLCGPAAGEEAVHEVACNLAALAYGAYDPLGDLLWQGGQGGLPKSMEWATTSKRLAGMWRGTKQRTPMLGVGVCGSERCQEILEKVGLLPGTLFDHPRLLLEIQLTDVARAAVMVLSQRREELFPGAPPASANPLQALASVKQPAGAGRYLQDGRCHDCGAGAGSGPPPGVQLKKCSRCGTARYCSKACQAADWNVHKQVCRELANWQQQLQAAKAETVAALQARGPRPTSSDSS
ncbi:hypothetical protein ABPG75_000987 [Micractinium tetrahymenae]